MRSLAVALVLTLVAARLACAQPEPAPPYPPPPPVAYRPVRPSPPPLPPPLAPPPPLSPLMRVLYAPFYAAGLVVRYGFYYALVAPFEVFDRAVTYGAKGGVERPRPPKAPEDEP